MITYNELRIGNHVLVDDRLQKVTSITTDSVFTRDPEEENESSEHSLEQLQPIALNDDILRQWGFVFHDYFHFWQRISSGIRSEMDIDRDYNVIDFMRKPIAGKLASLHQLQNIFFVLKGRELVVQQTVAAN